MENIDSNSFIKLFEEVFFRSIATGYLEQASMTVNIYSPIENGPYRSVYINIPMSKTAFILV